MRCEHGEQLGAASVGASNQRGHVSLLIKVAILSLSSTPPSTPHGSVCPPPRSLVDSLPEVPKRRLPKRRVPRRRFPKYRRTDAARSRSARAVNPARPCDVRERPGRRRRASCPDSAERRRTLVHRKRTTRSSPDSAAQTLHSVHNAAVEHPARRAAVFLGKRCVSRPITAVCCPY